MIDLSEISKEQPYLIFRKFYKQALESNQKIIEAISISSYDKNKFEVNSRFVNLKYIVDKEWIFFSNYKSPKAKQFLHHDQIAATIFWNSINVQIRMFARIKKTSEEFSDKHFKNRNSTKNALAISSNQSNRITSYQKVEKKYYRNLESDIDLSVRPSYWGGYSFEPYYFEFWEGEKNRLNKRQVFENNDNNWKKYFLEP